MTLRVQRVGRRYDENDFALANEVARRAASAIDNARLLFEVPRPSARGSRAATRAKDEFVAMVSHDFAPAQRHPGWLRLMRSGTLDEARRQHAFEVIERNAEAQGPPGRRPRHQPRHHGEVAHQVSQVDLSDVVEIAVEAARPAAAASGDPAPTSSRTGITRSPRRRGATPAGRGISSPTP